MDYFVASMQLVRTVEGRQAIVLLAWSAKLGREWSLAHLVKLSGSQKGDHFDVQSTRSIPGQIYKGGGFRVGKVRNGVGI